MPVPHDLSARIDHLLEGFGRDDLELLVQFVTLVAYSDGEIDEPELEALRASLETIFKSPLSMMVVKTLVGSAVDEIKAAGPDAYAIQLGKDLGARKKGEDAIRVGLAIAKSSNDVSSIERERLMLVAEGAGILAARFGELEAAES